jgi:hypothetical protein
MTQDQRRHGNLIFSQKPRKEERNSELPPVVYTKISHQMEADTLKERPTFKKTSMSFQLMSGILTRPQV